MQQKRSGSRAWRVAGPTSFPGPSRSLPEPPPTVRTRSGHRPRPRARSRTRTMRRSLCRRVFHRFGGSSPDTSPDRGRTRDHRPDRWIHALHCRDTGSPEWRGSRHRSWSRSLLRAEALRLDRRERPPHSRYRSSRARPKMSRRSEGRLRGRMAIRRDRRRRAAVPCSRSLPASATRLPVKASARALDEIWEVPSIV